VPISPGPTSRSRSSTICRVNQGTARPTDPGLASHSVELMVVIVPNSLHP
jgi:hypothetical protein